MINYSTTWATKNRKRLRNLPNVDVIVRHTKGYVGGDMWIYDKFDKNTFMYVQNGSSNVNWSDRQLVYLIATALRSKILNSGGHQSKVYKQNEDKIVRKKREKDLSIVHKKFYGKKNEKKSMKRVVIFDVYGPEIYEF